MLYAILNINDISDSDFRRFYALMPSERKRSCDLRKNINDKKLCVGAYMLLSRITGNDRLEFCYTQNGKPYIQDNPFYFSISHSGDIVAAAVSDYPVGIDVEAVKEVKDNVIKRVCTDNEIEFINKTGKESFYKIWTYKEAYLKMTGDGICDNLKKIDYTLRSDDIISFIKNGYAYCISKREPNP